MDGNTPQRDLRWKIFRAENFSCDHHYDQLLISLAHYAFSLLRLIYT